MHQHVAIGAKHGEVTEPCDSRCISGGELPSMMNLKHANTFATENSLKVNATRFAHAPCVLQGAISQFAVAPPHI